jgi:hypothetical protein
MPHPLRVVFFGPPRSGKSKLLDAVTAVARTFADDAIPLVTADPVTNPSGVVRRRVTVDLPGPRAETGDVEFIDCDGVAAQELLADADRLRRAKARTDLAASVRSTDALVVVIDATWQPEQVDEVFAQLDTFLKVLREQRAADREVGGLPVFLVLGKSDELAARGGPFTDWMARVDDEKAKLEARFRDWFAESAEPFLTFGSTDLTVAATATTWPDVLGGVADTSGGFGVDALHADVLRAAREHKERSVKSRRRLSWTAGTTVVLLAAMLLGLLGLALTSQPAAVDALAGRVRRMQQSFGPPEVRLADARFEANRRQLLAARDHPAFDLLPDDLKRFVEAELRQFKEYDGYRRAFDEQQFTPANLKRADERAELEKALDTTLAPPAGYADEWGHTEAVRLRQKWRTDLRLLEAAERQVFGWYTAELSRLNRLRLADVPSDEWTPAGWRAAVGAAVAWQPPRAGGEPLEGSPSVPLPRGQPLTWAAAYGYERATAAAEEWRQLATRLADTRDLADAVGFTVNPQKPEAVLDLPTPADARQSLGLAADRLAKLRDRYPRAAKGEAAWAVTAIPGPLQDALGRRLKVAAANGVDHARRLVADEVGAGGEWAKLAAPGGLLARPEMAAWGELLRLLVGWAEPERPVEDHVAKLREFVAKPEFRWAVAKVTLRLPNTFRANTAEKAGEMVVRVGDGPTARSYTLTAGKPAADETVTTVEFTPTDRDWRYAPGEGFTAAVTLTDKDGGYTLRWQEARTPAFRFEALLREPTVETVGPNPLPQRAEGVRVTVEAGEKSDPFRVPLLLPATK